MIDLNANDEHRELNQRTFFFWLADRAIDAHRAGDRDRADWLIKHLDRIADHNAAAIDAFAYLCDELIDVYLEL